MDDTSDRRSRKRQQTANLLAQTAFRLFESEGYEKVTMERIAAEADVAKGTLYNHFPVKEALLRHYFHRELAAFGATGMPLRSRTTCNTCISAH